MKPTEEQIAKLPKWAQEHIKTLSREREMAIRTLNKFTDDTIPSSIWIEEHPCTGEDQGPSRKTRFIQGHEVHFQHAGVYLSVFLSIKDDNQRNYGIQIQYSPGSRFGVGKAVAMIPKSHCCVELVAHQNMI